MCIASPSLFKCTASFPMAWGERVNRPKWFYKWLLFQFASRTMRSVGVTDSDPRLSHWETDEILEEKTVGGWELLCACGPRNPHFQVLHTVPAAVYCNFLSNFQCSLQACLAFSAFIQVSKCSMFVSHFSFPMLTWSFVLRSQCFPGFTMNLFFAVFPRFFSCEGGGDFFLTHCLWDETQICS